MQLSKKVNFGSSISFFELINIKKTQQRQNKYQTTVPKKTLTAVPKPTPKALPLATGKKHNNLIGKKFQNPWGGGERPPPPRKKNTLHPLKALQQKS